MCLNDLRDAIKNVLEEEGCGCVTAFVATGKVMKLVTQALEDEHERSWNDGYDTALDDVAGI